MDDGPGDAPTPVAVVDDHPLMREGLGALLEESGRYQMALEVAHGGELVEALEAGVLVALAVVDIRMPIMDGHATLQWLATHLTEQGYHTVVEALRLVRGTVPPRQMGLVYAVPFGVV